jgi:hypothetical protein
MDPNTSITAIPTVLFILNFRCKAVIVECSAIIRIIITGTIPVNGLVLPVANFKWNTTYRYGAGTVANIFTVLRCRIIFIRLGTMGR